MSTVLSSFQQNGYYHAPGVFNATELAGLETDFDRIVGQLQHSGEDANARWKGDAVREAEDGLDTIVLHTHQVQAYSAAWARALYHEGFLAVAREILGNDIILHHTKLFQKPPERGAPFPMHQDWTYFPTVKDTMIAGIVHVSEATDEMGCLRVYPGSHKLGRIAGTGGQKASDFLEDYPLDGATPVPCALGDVVFFHYFTLHGSMPNRSRKTRKTVLFQMHAGDDEVEPGNKHVNSRLVLSGWNHRMLRSRARLAGSA